MSSEVERAVVGGALPAPYPAAAGVRAGAASSASGALAAVLEVNLGLSSFADLEQALQEALRALNRHPGIARSALTLDLGAGRRLAVEAPPRGAPQGPALVDPRIARVPLSVDGRQVGALGAELSVDSATARDRAEVLLEAVAEVIGQSLTLRGRLAAAGSDAEELETESPHGAEGDPSLSARVAAYEQRLIEEALRATRGNRARAAKLLHTTERILGYRVQQYGIDCREYRR